MYVYTVWLRYYFLKCLKLFLAVADRADSQLTNFPPDIFIFFTDVV